MGLFFIFLFERPENATRRAYEPQDEGALLTACWQQRSATTISLQNGERVMPIEASCHCGETVF
ncbi:hypothetical protein AC630_23230 [Bradyrhizobium sp. AS23.2]|nr:hypothetical protein AC630_23230 [Bradyrhizobium sp. AS23.2]